MTMLERSVGAGVDRVEGGEKVRGEARYAYEYPVDRVAYGAVLASTVARGRIRSVDASAALALPGVIAVITHENALELGETPDRELAVLQDDRISYRGQIVGAVVAESYETARHAERLVRFEVDEEEHDVVLRADHAGLYRPDKVNPAYETDTAQGDFAAAFAAAEVRVDRTYETAATHNNPMEPHATLAVWDGGRVTLYDSNQGSVPVKRAVAKAFGLEPDDVRVFAPHVGGGFGSKGTPRPHVILAAMAAKLVGRPVKIAVTRQQMFAFTGYRTPTIQRLRLGATRDGRLSAIAHDVVEQTSQVAEFAEQTALATRMMYAGEHRRTTHRLARLDVPTPSWMRAPGETPGMYALESAMDELAIELGLDPVELRIRNEPELDPESGNRFSTRGLVQCLREGAGRFGWDGSDREPRPRRQGRFYVGTGVASSTYPARRRPSRATVLARPDGTYVVRLAAADIGTGARTVLAQIAADELGEPVERVRVELGDSDFPQAPLAGGSMGTASWGSAVVKACRLLRAHGGDEATADTADDVAGDEPLSKHGFGAQFAEVRVDAATGEVRVSRLLGVFAVGRIMNAKTARSQFLGGMTMGIGMALMEESVMDTAFGDYANHDLAQYHVPVCADVEGLEAHWLDEHDPHVNPMGAKGIGEIGIVGTAAAIANAVHHGTGVRVRDLPIRLDKLVAAGLV